jgi:phosphohistidine phosphatase
VNIFVLRHGEAGTRVSIASKDFERPLTETGKNDIEKIANSMLQLGVSFDKVISSPLKRAKETAEILTKVYEKQSPKLEVWEELRPEGSRSELLQKLSKQKQDTDVLLVGHEPYLSTLIGEIISGSSIARILLKKGGVAKVQIVSFSPKVTGELRWLLTPRHLKKLAN